MTLRPTARPGASLAFEAAPLLVARGPSPIPSLQALTARRLVAAGVTTDETRVALSDRASPALIHI